MNRAMGKGTAEHSKNSSNGGTINYSNFSSDIHVQKHRRTENKACNKDTLGKDAISFYTSCT